MTKAAIRIWHKNKAGNERAHTNSKSESLGNWPGTKNGPFPSKEWDGKPGAERNCA